MGIYYNHNTPIELVMYGEYIKYNELDQIIPVEYKNNDYDRVINIYIDLYQFLITIYRYTFIQDPYSIASCIINYAGHIRRYFKTRCDVYAKIILVYSTNNNTTNTQFYKDYNAFYNERVRTNTKIDEIVAKNLKLVEMLIPYFPDIFLKVGSVETSVIIYGLIKDKVLGIHPNLVLSNSQLMYGLAAELKSVVVIKKDLYLQNHIDTTHAFNHTNALAYFIYDLKKRKFNHKFNDKLTCFLMALIGVPKRAVKSICSITMALKILDLVPLGFEHDIDTLCDSYFKYFEITKRTPRVTRDYLERRIKCLDIIYQYKLYCELPESKEKDFLTQLEDKDSVQYLNNTYFEHSPLHLDDF